MHSRNVSPGSTGIKRNQRVCFQYSPDGPEFKPRGFAFWRHDIFTVGFFHFLLQHLLNPQKALDNRRGDVPNWAVQPSYVSFATLRGLKTEEPAEAVLAQMHDD